MDEMGIDVQAVSINAFWYSADRDLAARLIDLQNQRLAAMVKANQERFVAFASVALQFPEMAGWRLRGAAIGGKVPGEERHLLLIQCHNELLPPCCEPNSVAAIQAIREHVKRSSTSAASRSRKTGELHFTLIHKGCASRQILEICRLKRYVGVGPRGAISF
jgi:hypothetical protein